MIRTFRELKRLRTFLERYEYLQLRGVVGNSVFGYDRYLNQNIYRSKRWKQARDSVIIRDNGCDLGIEDYRIAGRIVIHHMNPLTLDDVEQERSCIFDPDGLICTTIDTHNAIHYGDANLLPALPVERRKGDTSLWQTK